MMVTVFYRDNVYVDITAPDRCDIHHLAVPFQPHSLKPDTNKAFSELKEEYLQLLFF